MRFMGAGADGQGANMLGQILMRVRDELMGRIDPSEDFICYNTPSDYFAQRNGKVCAQGQKFTPIQTQPQTSIKPSKPSRPSTASTPSYQPSTNSSELEQSLYQLKDSLNELKNKLRPTSYIVPQETYLGGVGSKEKPHLI